MQVTYLGHAGFIAESRDSVVVMDPWLSPGGAFDASWFQLPANQHLAALVQEKLADPSRARFIYVSHEHKDHFDPSFLRSLVLRDFTFLIPKYRRSALRDAVAGLECRGMELFEDGQSLGIPGGEVRLFLDDSELNRDSAIHVRLGDSTFLNMNDCKLHDVLPTLAPQLGRLDVFACQFSGATWHPVCYEYDEPVYQRISRKKMLGKFEATAKAIEALRPRIYLPSAGPACFLDPLLFHINFQEVNIFPPAFKFLPWLEKRLKKSVPVALPVIMPGDLLDVSSGEFLTRAARRLEESNFHAYLREYASEYELLFRSRRFSSGERERLQVLDQLQRALEEKLRTFTMRARVGRPLYVRFSDAPAMMLRVDFSKGQVAQASDLEPDHYVMSAPSWEIARVLDGRLTWEDFSLTFRMRLNRQPDVYQTLVQGFLIMEAEDLEAFCRRLLAIESSRERIPVEAGGCRYTVNRYCPHQGGDLSEGWVDDDRFLVCPRHRWRFDLHQGGRAEGNDGTIDAIALEAD